MMFDTSDRPFGQATQLAVHLVFPLLLVYHDKEPEPLIDHYLCSLAPNAVSVVTRRYYETDTWHIQRLDSMLAHLNRNIYIKVYPASTEVLEQLSTRHACSTLQLLSL